MPRRRAGIVVGGTLVGMLMVGVLGALIAGRDPTPAPPGTPSSAASSPAMSGSPASSPPPSAFVPSSGAAAAVLDGIPCDPTSHDLDFHIHAHLNIRVDGVLSLPPANVGVLAGCSYWLHTHAPYGVIHIEAPDEQTFVLGQFFAIWAKPLSASSVGDASVGPGRSLFVFIDRVPSQVVDPATIPLRDVSAIELQIGTAPLAPLPYTFPSDLGGG